MKKNSQLYLILAIFFSFGCGAIGKFTSSSVDVPTDPLVVYAWHLENTGQKVFATQAGVPGADLNLSTTWESKIFGKDIIIQISDDGIQDTHEDINANFPYLNYSKDYSMSSPYTSTTGPAIATTDNHGSAVAGLAAAVGYNGVGSRGVAPSAKLVSANFISDAITRTGAMLYDQALGDFDISNMSWGAPQNRTYSQDTTYSSQLKTMILNGRLNKGAVFVKAAGNEFVAGCFDDDTDDCIGNSNFDDDNSNPYIILVGALNNLGESSSYSSIGSNIWISAFGGEYGGLFNGDGPAMVTVDRTGCSAGYSVSSATGSFEKGTSSENSGCNYTSQFNGTSSAAPVLTGVVALILEANPNLTWREVKYILAKTAAVDNFETGSLTHPLGNTMPTGYVWEQKWIRNGALFAFHNWYGFGRVDVDAAIALAKSALTTPLNLGTYSEPAAEEVTALGLAIPDNSATGVSYSFNVSANVKIEALEMSFEVSHVDVGDLAIEVTSPAGTKNIILNGQSSLRGMVNLEISEKFLTNAYYQEMSSGTWTIKVVDTKAVDSGTLNSIRMKFFGGI